MGISEQTPLDILVSRMVKNPYLIGVEEAVIAYFDNFNIRTTSKRRWFYMSIIRNGNFRALEGFLSYGFIVPFLLDVYSALLFETVMALARNKSTTIDATSVNYISAVIKRDANSRYFVSRFWNDYLSQYDIGFNAQKIEIGVITQMNRILPHLSESVFVEFMFGVGLSNEIMHGEFDEKVRESLIWKDLEYARLVEDYMKNSEMDVKTIVESVLFRNKLFILDLMGTVTRYYFANELKSSVRGFRDDMKRGRRDLSSEVIIYLQKYGNRFVDDDNTFTRSSTRPLFK